MKKRRIISFVMVLVMALSLISFSGIGTAHVKAAGAYQTWKQYDSAWGNKVLQTMTMAKGGCRVTAMAMLLVKAGWKNESNFDPGVALDLFKQTGVVINGNMCESNISKAVSDFVYCGSKNLQQTSRTDTINFIKSLYDQGYYCELLVKNGGHAVALENVSGNTINVVDPGYGARNAFDVYSLWGGSGINHVFWFAGTAANNNNNNNNNSNNPGSPYSIPARNLGYGSSGNDVKWVQQCLNETIGASLSIDGIYGNDTIYAVRVFQSNYGLTADGIVGTNTTNKMLEVWQAAKNKDTQAPTISNISVSEVSLSGYRVTCTVTDNVGVAEVKFPTWTVKGGQDDLIWHKGSISGNTATYYVKASEHTNGRMNYITHIYAWDAAGNQQFADAGVINLSQLGNKQDLGNDFYGVIQNTTTKTVLQNTEKADSKDVNKSRIIQAYRLTGEENQLWHFQKMANGSYEITSLSDNRKLDYYGIQDITGTQVWAYNSNASDGQRWYFYQAENGTYYIQGAACQDTLLDLYGCNATDGSNLVLHQINKSNAQKFAVKKYYKVSFRNNGEEVKAEWVAEGDSATAPDLNKNGYILSWDKDFQKVNSDVLVNAVWTKEIEPEETQEVSVPTEEPKPSEEAWTEPTEEPKPSEEAWTEPTEEPKPSEEAWTEPTKKPSLSEEMWNSAEEMQDTDMEEYEWEEEDMYEESGGKQKSEKLILAKPVIKKLLNRKGGKVIVKIKKATMNVQGYQIRYSAQKSFSAKTIKIRGKHTHSQTIKNLKKNKKYYFSIRSYRTVQGKTYYSAWSNKKAIRIRK